MASKLDKIKLENITSKLRQSEYLLQPKDTPNDAFWDFINQFLQVTTYWLLQLVHQLTIVRSNVKIDTRTQSVSEADTDDRHSGWLLLIMFIGCAFLVFAPVLVLLW